MAQDSNPRTLNTVETSLQIMEYLEETGGARVTDVADEFGMSKGGAYCHLATLWSEKYIVRDGKKYKLGQRFIQKANTVRYQSDLFLASKDQLEWLAEETEESVMLMKEEFGQGVNIYAEKGEQSVAADWIMQKLGRGVPLNVNAPGKSILAHLPDDRIDEIIETHGLPGFTENTITDRDELAEELAAIQEQGFALNDEEEDNGFRAVAAPVCDSGDVLGAISVSGPTSRLEDEYFFETLPNKVVEAANIAEINLATAEKP